MTSKMLLEQYMEERRALGFSLKTDEGCIRRFLQDFVDPDDGDISFTKEYVLSHIGNRRNMQTNTILRDVSAINGFLDFVVRKGYTAYRIPPKSLPKENRNFKAYIFTDEEIEQILIAADHTAFTEQNPARTYQLPVMFRILFNCGLRTSELLKLRMRDVDLEENVFIILDTKFHKNRLVPFSTTVAEALKEYLEKIQETVRVHMTSGTPLLCIALITGCFRVKILPLPYLSFHDILGIMGYPERKSICS